MADYRLGSWYAMMSAIAERELGRPCHRVAELRSGRGVRTCDKPGRKVYLTEGSRGGHYCEDHILEGLVEGEEWDREENGRK